MTVENSFVTMAPSLSPSVSPSTSIPTIAPTITGAVALIDLTKVVEEELTSEALFNITKEIVETYGVSEDDVEIDVDYVIEGKL